MCIAHREEEEEPMKIEFEISTEDAALVQQFLDLYASEDIGTHGKHDTSKLASMIFEDVALAIQRSGSWEGSQMGTLLYAHGYGHDL
jgi:hypothetical protein